MKKLTLNRETVRRLSDRELQNAAGGDLPTNTCYCSNDVICITRLCPLPSRGVGDCHTVKGNNCGSETTVIVCC